MESESFVGFNTDPLRSGYQTLSNYESTFWRAYTGSQEWALYEILRSFCHAGKSECNPSILLLCSILGISDRRTLIGRTKRKEGKLILYDGLMEKLQRVSLLYITVKGEGGGMRYTFHVNLTPSLLGEEQVSQLPDLLQKKHAELLERCSKKKSMGLSLPSVGQSHTQGGTIPNKQNQLNNTQEQTDQDRAMIEDLVAAGWTKKNAMGLVSLFGVEKIKEKLKYLLYLRRTDPYKIKSPHGWLRKAVEEDYDPPEGYLDPSEPTPLERYIEEVALEEESIPPGVVYPPEDALFQEELRRVYSGEMERIGHLIRVEDKIVLAIPDCWLDWVTDRLGSKIRKILGRMSLDQTEFARASLVPSRSPLPSSSPASSFSHLESGLLPALSAGVSWTHSFPTEKERADPSPS